MKKIFALVIAAPILALFVGIGVLAFGISHKWDERNTDMLINNITLVCGIGGFIIVLLLAAFIGLLFYARWQRDHDWSPPSKLLPRTRSQQPGWHDSPPLLPPTLEQKGKLLTMGPGSYEDLSSDLFSDTNTIEPDDWRKL